MGKERGKKAVIDGYIMSVILFPRGQIKEFNSQIFDWKGSQLEVAVPVQNNEEALKDEEKNLYEMLGHKFKTEEVHQETTETLGEREGVPSLDLIFRARV